MWSMLSLRSQPWAYRSTTFHLMTEQDGMRVKTLWSQIPSQFDGMCGLIWCRQLSSHTFTQENKSQQNSTLRTAGSEIKQHLFPPDFDFPRSQVEYREQFRAHFSRLQFMGKRNCRIAGDKLGPIRDWLRDYEYSSTWAYSTKEVLKAQGLDSATRKSNSIYLCARKPANCHTPSTRQKHCHGILRRPVLFWGIEIQRAEAIQCISEDSRNSNVEPIFHFFAFCTSSFIGIWRARIWLTLNGAVLPYWCHYQRKR